MQGQRGQGSGSWLSPTTRHGASELAMWPRFSPQLGQPLASGEVGRKERQLRTPGRQQRVGPRGCRKAFSEPEWLSWPQRRLSPPMLASVFLVWDSLEVDPRGWRSNCAVFPAGVPPPAGGAAMYEQQMAPETQSAAEHLLQGKASWAVAEFYFPRAIRPQIKVDSVVLEPFRNSPDF